MTDTENTSEAPKPRTKNATPAASGDAAAPAAPAAVPASADTTTPTVPAAPAPTPARGPGRGILIGAIAATLVGGLGIGGVGGFALATAVEHHAPAFAGQAGPRDDRPGFGEQGERPGDDHRMPGQPPQSGPGSAPGGGTPGTAPAPGAPGTAPAPGTTESPDSGGQ
jgi:hypothetical protein